MTNQKGADASGDGAQHDRLGTLTFSGFNTNATPGVLPYAKIVAEIDVATDGEESGKLTFEVANHNGTLGDGLILTGGSEAGEIDVTVGLGANSVVTIPGK